MPEAHYIATTSYGAFESRKAERVSMEGQTKSARHERGMATRDDMALAFFSKPVWIWKKTNMRQFRGADESE